MGRTGGAFKERDSRARFRAQAITQLGIYKEEAFRASRLFFRKKLPSPAVWKYKGVDAGATFFSLPNGRMIAVKPEYEPYPFNKVGVSKVGANGRWRDTNAVLTEVLRRRIPFEVPLGRIRAPEGRWFYVTEAVKGSSLEKKFRAMPEAQALQVAKNMGKYVGFMQRKGVLHLEPSPHNWIISGTHVKMVDTKYVAFKKDFENLTNNGNGLNWEKEAKDSAEACATWIPHHAKQAYWEAYRAETGRGK